MIFAGWLTAQAQPLDVSEERAHAQFAGGFQLNYTQNQKRGVLPSNGINLAFHLGLWRGKANGWYIGATFMGRPSWWGTNHRYQMVPENLDPYLATHPSTPIDSERIALLGDNFGSRGNGHHDSGQLLCYGLIFSPSTHRFGCPQFQIRRGSYFYFPVLGNNRKYVLNEEDILQMNAPIDYTLQFSLKPLTFFGPKNPDHFWWGDLLSMGIYYERISLRRATFDGQSMLRFFTPAFAARYAISHRIGFTVGVGLDAFGWK